jgi:hypothetical protein
MQVSKLEFGFFLSLLFNEGVNTETMYSDDRSINEGAAVGGKRICRENKITWTEPTQVPLCPPHIQNDLTWHWTLGTVAGT